MQVVAGRYSIAASPDFVALIFSVPHRYSIRHEYLEAKRKSLILGGNWYLCMHVPSVSGPVFREDIKLETNGKGGSRSSKDCWAVVGAGAS